MNTGIDFHSSIVPDSTIRPFPIPASSSSLLPHHLLPFSSAPISASLSTSASPCLFLAFLANTPVSQPPPPIAYVIARHVCPHTPRRTTHHTTPHRRHTPLKPQESKSLAARLAADAAEAVVRREARQRRQEAKRAGHAGVPVRGEDPAHDQREKQLTKLATK